MTSSPRSWSWTSLRDLRGGGALLPRLLEGAGKAPRQAPGLRGVAGVRPALARIRVLHDDGRHLRAQRRGRGAGRQARRLSHLRRRAPVRHSLPGPQRGADHPGSRHLVLLGAPGDASPPGSSSSFTRSITSRSIRLPGPPTRSIRSRPSSRSCSFPSLLLLPTHGLVLLIFFLAHMIVRNVWGHLGMELLPGWLNEAPIVRWWAATTHRSMHTGISR